MLTDFFIANFTDLDSINSSDDLAGFATIRAKRIDPVKISTLETLMGINDEEFAEPVKEIDSDGWIIPIKRQLVAELAGKSSEDIMEIASEWSKTEEWQLDNADVNQLKDFLKSLSQLAQQAAIEGKKMFVMVSL